MAKHAFEKDNNRDASCAMKKGAVSIGVAALVAAGLSFPSMAAADDESSNVTSINQAQQDDSTADETAEANADQSGSEDPGDDSDETGTPDADSSQSSEQETTADESGTPDPTASGDSDPKHLITEDYNVYYPEETHISLGESSIDIEPEITDAESGEVVAIEDVPATFKLEAAPEGITIDPETGVITVAADVEEGAYDFQVVTTFEDGSAATQIINVIVGDGDAQEYMNDQYEVSYANETAEPGEDGVFKPVLKDAETGEEVAIEDFPGTFSSEDAPEGIEVAEDGTITSSADLDEGVYEFRVIVTFEDGTVLTSNVNITVGSSTEDPTEDPTDGVEDPSLKIDPESVTISDFMNEDKGVVMGVNNLKPGEEITFEVDPADGQRVAGDEITAVADDNGVAAATVHGTDAAPAEYYLGEYSVVVDVDEDQVAGASDEADGDVNAAPMLFAVPAAGTEQQPQTTSLDGSFTVVADDTVEDPSEGGSEEPVGGNDGSIDGNDYAGDSKPSGPSLANTGAQITGLALAAGLAIAGGITLAVRSRRSHG